MSNKAPPIRNNFSKVLENFRPTNSMDDSTDSLLVSSILKSRGFSAERATGIQNPTASNLIKNEGRVEILRQGSLVSNCSLDTERSTSFDGEKLLHLKYSSVGKLPSIVDSKGKNIVQNTAKHPLCNMPEDVALNFHKYFWIRDLIRLSEVSKNIINEAGWQALFKQRYEVCGPRMKNLKMKKPDASRLQLQKDYFLYHERMFRIRQSHKLLVNKTRWTHRVIFILRTLVQEDMLLRQKDEEHMRMQKEARHKDRNRRLQQRAELQESYRKATQDALLMVGARGLVRSHERPVNLRNSTAGLLAPTTGRRLPGVRPGSSYNTAQCLVWQTSV